MSLHYVNLTDGYCRNDFVRNAPPLPAPVSTASPISAGEVESDEELNMSEQELRFITDVNDVNDNNVPPPTVVAEDEPSTNKRTYTKISQQQLDTLKTIYNRNGPNYPVSKYSEVTGIKGSRIRNLITLLKKGVTIDKSKITKGRNRIIAPNTVSSIASMIKDNNRITLKDIRSNLSEMGITVSVPTIHRTLNYRMEDVGLKNITLKRCVVRSSRVADVEKLKKERIEVIRKLHNYIAQGYRVCFIDETHWSLGICSRQARSDVNTPAVVHSNTSPTQITVIAAMSELGTHYCQCIYGSNDFDVFRSYILRLIDDLKGIGRFLLFLDNVNLHHNAQTEKIILDSGNAVLFNTTYSSPMNPIENVFSFWKKRAEAVQYMNREQVLQKISDAFKSITPQECYSTIQHVYHSIHLDVINRKDI